MALCLAHGKTGRVERTVAPDSRHSRVVILSSSGRPRMRSQAMSTSLGWHSEDVLRDLLVAILDGWLASLGEHRRAVLPKGTGNVLQENQFKHDVLELRGVHRTVECVCQYPRRGLVTNGAQPLGVGASPSNRLLDLRSGLADLVCRKNQPRPSTHRLATEWRTAGPRLLSARLLSARLVDRVSPRSGPSRPRRNITIGR